MTHSVSQRGWPWTRGWPGSSDGWGGVYLRWVACRWGYISQQGEELRSAVRRVEPEGGKAAMALTVMSLRSQIDGPLGWTSGVCQVGSNWSHSRTRPVAGADLCRGEEVRWPLLRSGGASLSVPVKAGSLGATTCPPWQEASAVGSILAKR